MRAPLAVIGSVGRGVSAHAPVVDGKRPTYVTPEGVQGPHAPRLAGDRPVRARRRSRDRSAAGPWAPNGKTWGNRDGPASPRPSPSSTLDPAAAAASGATPAGRLPRSAPRAAAPGRAGDERRCARGPVTLGEAAERGRGAALLPPREVQGVGRVGDDGVHGLGVEGGQDVQAVPVVDRHRRVPVVGGGAGHGVSARARAATMSRAAGGVTALPAWRTLSRRLPSTT